MPNPDRFDLVTIFVAMAVFLMPLPASAAAGDVVATNETLETQWVQIPGWDMGNYTVADIEGGVASAWAASKTFYTYPAFACAKQVSISVAIRSDPMSSGQPFFESFTRTNFIVSGKNSHGGEVRARCYTQNPSYINFDLLQYWRSSDLRQQAPLFVFAPSNGYPAPFRSTTATRGWIKLEYIK
jgi:hypothetical protein